MLSATGVSAAARWSVACNGGEGGAVELGSEKMMGEGVQAAGRGLFRSSRGS